MRRAVIIGVGEHVQQFGKLRHLRRGRDDFRHIGQRSHHPVGQMQGHDEGMVIVYVLLLYLLPLALIIGIETIWLKANDIKHPGKE